jgi:hypothetical protein
MNDLKLPAYPRTHSEMNAAAWGENAGFTKLELAALMIAQGIAGTNGDYSQPLNIKALSTTAVHIAKAVLEEANK